MIGQGWAKLEEMAGALLRGVFGWHDAPRGARFAVAVGMLMVALSLLGMVVSLAMGTIALAVQLLIWAACVVAVWLLIQAIRAMFKGR